MRKRIFTNVLVIFVCGLAFAFFLEKNDSIDRESGNKFFQSIYRASDIFQLNLGDINNCADSTGDCTFRYVNESTSKSYVAESEAMPSVCVATLPTAGENSPEVLYLDCEDRFDEYNEHDWYGVRYELEKACTGICRRCNPGYYLEDDTTCKICPKGYYCSGTEEFPTVCNFNEYQDEEGQTSCKKCPNGKGTLSFNASDSISIDACVVCSEAYPGTHYSEYLGCVCSTGRYWANNGQCSVCPDGTYQDEQNSESCKTCSGTVNNEKTTCSSTVITCHDVYVGDDTICTLNTGSITGSVTSSDESIFVVKSTSTSSFVITGKSAGTATVTAKVGSENVTATVTVYGSLSSPITSITITEPENIELPSVGSSRRISYTVEPESSYGAGIIWTSSNTTIAEIGASSGVLLGKAPGTVTITARSEANSSIVATKQFTISFVNDCSISLVEVVSNRNMSVNEQGRVKFSIDGRNCSTRVSVVLQNLSGDAEVDAEANYNYTASTSCAAGIIKGCIKGTNICSDELVVNIYPEWTSTTVNNVSSSTYEASYNSALEANRYGSNEYYDQCTGLNDNVYASCVKHTRSCTSIEEPQNSCYNDGSGTYHWTSLGNSGWTKDTSATTYDACIEKNSTASSNTNSSGTGTSTTQPSGTETTEGTEITETPIQTVAPETNDGGSVGQDYQVDNQVEQDVKVPSTGFDVKNILYVFMGIMMISGIVFIYYSTTAKKKN